jgi:hypothetical protein
VCALLGGLAALGEQHEDRRVVAPVVAVLAVGLEVAGDMGIPVQVD